MDLESRGQRSELCSGTRASGETPASPHLVVLWVEQLGQLVEDEPGVGDRAAERVAHRCVEMVGGEYSVGRRKPRPHHQHGVGGLVKLTARDGRLQLPEGVADEGQRLTLHAEPGRDVVGSRRQHHVVGQDGELGYRATVCGQKITEF